MRKSYRIQSALLVLLSILGSCHLLVLAQRRLVNLTVAAKAAVSAADHLVLTPCRLPKLDEEVRCGKYEVFEDRAAKSGRKIALNVVVMPALAAKPAPDPVFFIAGGPGQSVVSAIPLARKDLVAKIRRERDVVLVDQRGAGESNPLNCPRLTDRDDMQGYFNESGPGEAARARACRPILEKTANLTLYTTSIAMADLDDVRAALGYDRINLDGGSYGTAAAFVYMREHPEHVRSVFMESVAPVNFKNPLPMAKGIQHAIERLYEDCAAEPQCHAAYPEAKAEFDQVIARLDKGPLTITTVNPATNKEQEITLTRSGFVNQVRLLLYAPEYSMLLPLLIHYAAQGDLGPFARAAFLIGRATEDQIARGLNLSINCAESEPFISEQETARESAGTYLGDYLVKTKIAACAEWPRAKVPTAYLEPVKSNAPVLIIAGDEDPVTPLWLAEAAAKYLPNSRVVVNRYGAHGTRAECTDNVVAEFFAKGSAKDLNVSCIAEFRRPPFLTSVPGPAGKPADGGNASKKPSPQVDF